MLKFNLNNFIQTVQFPYYENNRLRDNNLNKLLAINEK